MQWLLVIGLIALVYFFFIKKKPLNQANKHSGKKQDEADMVECSACGVYVSLDEALIRDGKYFCSHECMKG